MINFSSAKQKESFTENSLVVIEASLGTKYFANFYVGVPVAERIGWKDGHTSATALCTLHKAYKIPGLLPTYFTFLYCCSVKLPFLRCSLAAY